MKKYLIISLISGILISSLVYAIVYIPSVRDYFSFNFKGKDESSISNGETFAEKNILFPKKVETLPNLTILSSDNFKSVKFGDLNLRVMDNFKVNLTAEKINLELDKENQITGFYYPLISVPRKDIDVSSFESELLKNTYLLEKKSNIPDEFVKNVFDLSIGSMVEDLIGGELITYEVKDTITSKSPNLTGYFFHSNKDGYYKYIILTTKKLYIFNARNDYENLIKVMKTFYNLDFN